MTPDMINGGFEFAAGLAILNHCFALLRDRRVAGVSTASAVFFTAWGGWNIFYYPHLDQFWSFAGGIFVTLANLIYLALLVAYSRHRLARWIKRQTVCRVRGHRNDALDFDGYHLYPCRRCGVDVSGGAWTDIPAMSAEVWEEEQRLREVP